MNLAATKYVNNFILVKKGFHFLFKISWSCGVIWTFPSQFLLVVQGVCEMQVRISETTLRLGVTGSLVEYCW